MSGKAGRYLLSPRAQADLRQIWDFSAERWGVEQAETYLRMIQQVIETIAASPDRGRRRDDVRTGYLSLAAGSHILFNRAVGEGIDIVRILHHRMDFARHL